MTPCFPVDLPPRVALRFLVALLLSVDPLPLDAQLSRSFLSSSDSRFGSELSSPSERGSSSFIISVM